MTTDLKIGTNWGASKRHVLSRPMNTNGTWTYKDAWLTHCGRSITAYDPNDAGVPSHLKGADLGNVPWCKPCSKIVDGAEPPKPKVVDFSTMSTEDQIAEFMRRGKQLDEIGVNIDQRERLNYLIEEAGELEEAITDGWLGNVDIDDALADIAWVAIGWLYKRRGVPGGKAVLAEVNRANMTKVEPIENMVFYPGTKKIGKPEGWVGPDHERALREAGAL